MKLVKKTAEYKIFVRRDGRHAMQSKNGKMVNGDDKVAILITEKLVKKPKSKPKPETETETVEQASSEKE